MNTIISIIMAVRNNSQTITSAIKSILNQTYQNWELIVIDDASTDDICLPTRLEKQIKFMQQNPKIDILGTWATQIDSQGQIIGHSKPPVEHSQITKRFKRLRHHNPMI